MFRAVLVASMLVAMPATADDLAAARAALKAAPIIDGHNDLPHALRQQNGSRTSDFDFAKLPDRFAGKIVTDFAMMKAGGVGGQFWSVYVPAETEGPDAVRRTIEQIDIIERLIDASPTLLARASTAADVERIMKSGRIASMFGAEGGHSIGNSLGVLRQLHTLGVRYMTLTHSRTTDWADSATDAPKHNGLAPFGKAVVAEMNRLGMLVDLSHVSPKVMHDALDLSAAPVIFSHSAAKALMDKPRNVPDDVLRRLPQNGGVIMVYFAETSLAKAADDWNRAREAEQARLKYDYPDQAELVAKGLADWDAANPRGKSAVSDVADHIDHVRKVAGIDAIGIGSDFDGLPTYPAGLQTTADYPALFAELARRGYTGAELRKIASGNILRVMRQAEAVAARLQKTMPPGEMLFSGK